MSRSHCLRLFGRFSSLMDLVKNMQRLIKKANQGEMNGYHLFLN